VSRQGQPTIGRPLGQPVWASLAAHIMGCLRQPMRAVFCKLNCRAALQINLQSSNRDKADGGAGRGEEEAVAVRWVAAARGGSGSVEVVAAQGRRREVVAATMVQRGSKRRKGKAAAVVMVVEVVLQMEGFVVEFGEISGEFCRKIHENSN
jgi:hypothetical protein